MSKIPRGEIKRTRPLATAAVMGDIATVKKLLALRGDKKIEDAEIIEAYINVEDFGHQGVKTLLAEHPAVRNIYGLTKPAKKSKKKQVKFVEIEEEPLEIAPEKMSVFIKDLLKDTPLPKKAKTAKAKGKTAKVAKRQEPLKDVGGYELTAKERKLVLELRRKIRSSAKEEAEKMPKKNISAFLFYKKKKEADLAKTDPEMPVKDVKKLIEVTWKSMSEKQKKPYETKAQKDASRYQKEKAAYDKTKKYSPVF